MYKKNEGWEFTKKCDILLGKLPTLYACVAFLLGYHTLRTLYVVYNVS
jgi:hypothetical protein